jgi:hypothetical protein
MQKEESSTLKVLQYNKGVLFSGGIKDWWMRGDN